MESIKYLATLGDPRMLYGGLGGQERSDHAEQLKTSCPCLFRPLQFDSLSPI